MNEWLWYPGEFDSWLYNKVHTRRRDYNGAVYPPIWQMDAPNPILWAFGTIELPGDEWVSFRFQGEGTLKVDGKIVMAPPEGGRVRLTSGRHSLEARVYDNRNFPAVSVCCETSGTRPAFRVGVHQSTMVDPEYGEFAGMPGGFALPRREVTDAKGPKGGFTVYPDKPVVIDCGMEMYGYVTLKGLKGSSPLVLRFGESLEEAMSTEVTQFHVVHTPAETFVPDVGAAFRYVCLDAGISPVEVGGVLIEEEYCPAERLGSFESSDPLLNRIWDVSARTLELCSREFLLDGIKRDHWVWSGDALQELLMSYYLFSDQALCRRTISALRGKDPVPHHINRIMDYSFYWILSLWTHYLHTGDAALIRNQYPKVVTLLDYCAGRENAEGFMPARDHDWIFVDWAPIDNSGEVALEQLLYARALEQAAAMAELAGDNEAGRRYSEKGSRLREKVMETFWDEASGALLHNRREDGTLGSVTKYASMFALFFGYLDDAKRKRVVDGVLTDPEVLPITTPYMRFYELEALCQMGRQEQVLQEIKEYWGGMLDLGATSFWELYDPREEGAAHYAMYGDTFGKSLCHGWGASPLYLLGRYYLGVVPTSPGYATFDVRPNLGGLGWFKGSVPLHCDSGSCPVLGIGAYAEGDGFRYVFESPKEGGNLLLSKGALTDTDGNVVEPVDRGYGLYAYPLPAGRSEFLFVKA